VSGVRDFLTLPTVRAGDPAAIARALVRLPSVNPSLDEDGCGEGDVANFCYELLDGWGLEVRRREVAPGRPNVVARMYGEGPALLLNGHLDTVGVGGMVVEPFAGALSADDDHEPTLFGRGSCDMKGGIAAILGATARLARSDSPRPNLIVALTVDEEHASLGMSHLIDSGVRAEMAVVCEPTGLAVAPAHKGFVWAAVEFGGVAAHGSRPDLGIDAIRNAGEYLAGLESLHADLSAREPHPLLGIPSFHAGTIHGGSADSIYPESCVLTLERRTLPGEAPEIFLRELDEAASGLRSAGHRVTIRQTLARPATETPVDSALTQGLLAALRRCGIDDRVASMSAWVDAAFLNQAGIPAVCFGPGDIALAHTAAESVPVREIEDCARVLEEFAGNLTAWS